jgi:hypothetical protein
MTHAQKLLPDQELLLSCNAVKAKNFHVSDGAVSTLLNKQIARRNLRQHFRPGTQETQDEIGVEQVFNSTHRASELEVPRGHP